jgi:hypothetical protein
MTKLIAGLVAMVAVVPALGWADQSEWRIGAGGGAAVMQVQLGGAEGVGLGYAAQGRLDYGLSNVLELGVVGSYAHASDIEVDGRAVGGETGTLYADVSTFALGIEARWTPGLSVARAFERTSPYLAARAGAAFGLRTNQELFTPKSLLLSAPADDVSLTPWAGGALGVEHRFGDRLFLGGEVAVVLGGDDHLLELGAEASWAWY